MPNPLLQGGSVEGVSLDRMIRAVRRELGLRRVSYPQRVQRREMDQHQAREEYYAMQAVLTLLEGLQSRGRNSGTL